MLMGSIDIGKIIVKPFKFYEIREIKIEKKLNDHSFMFVKGIIKDEEGFSPVDTMTGGTSVKCINNGKTYFSGILQSVKVIKTSGNQHYLEVCAVSSTILLDTVKHKRSFQNNAQTYQDIVESVIAENNGKVTYNADVMNVENIILQYDETDWEFAKRLASHTQDVLIAITDDAPAFHFGATDKNGGTLNPSSYSKSKNFDILRKMSDELEPLVESDIILCSAETNDLVCDLGEKLNVNEEELYVCHISVTINEKSASLRVIYTLCSKKAIAGPKYYNKATTGLVLDGEVLELEGDTLRLKLYVYDKHGSGNKVYIDDDQSAGNEHFFKYATGYSAENHTGWYVMPEVEDVVQLFFPNENEKNAYAASSIRQENSSDRTNDHLQKFMRTPFGKEIKFDKNKILITAKDSTTFIRITEESGIEIMTPDPIKVTSKNSTIDVTAGNDINVLTHANMNVTVKGDATVLVEGDADTTVKGDATVLVEGDTDTTVMGDATVLVEGDTDTTVKGDATVLVEGNTDTTVKGNATVLVEGDSDTTVKGDATVLVEGNTDTTVKGDATVLVEGDSDTTVKGDATVLVEGDTDTTVKGDATVLVEGNTDTTVKGDATLSVDGNADATIKGNATLSVDGNATTSIKGNATTSVNGNESTTIKGNMIASIAGSVAISATGDMALSTAKNLAISAGDSISISCPGNSISMVPDSGISVSTEKEFTMASDKNASFGSKEEIEIKSGKNTKIDAGDGADIKSGKDTKIASGAKLDISASSGTKIVNGGSSIKLESSGIDIKGPSVKIN